MNRAVLILLLAFSAHEVTADVACPKGQGIINLEAKRAELLRLAESYHDARMGNEYANVRAKIMELDAEFPYAYLRQEIAFFPISKQPYCMILAFSTATGIKTAVQPRTDGKWNVYVNDVKTHEGLTDSELLTMVKTAVIR